MRFNTPYPIQRFALHGDPLFVLVRREGAQSVRLSRERAFPFLTECPPTKSFGERTRALNCVRHDEDFIFSVVAPTILSGRLLKGQPTFDL